MRLPVFCLLALLACFGCSQSESFREPLLPNGALILPDSGAFAEDWSTENTLTIHATSEPDNLHPVNGNSSLRSEILQLSQLFLISNRLGTTIEPELVRQLPAISPDGRTFVFELSEVSTWPDGSHVTSEDVLFTIKVNASGLANNPAGMPYWNRVESVKQNSEWKFTLTLKERIINDVAFLASFPVLERKYYDPADHLGKYDLQGLRQIADSSITDKAVLDWSNAFNSTRTGTDVSKLYCTGKYEVVEWSVGRHIILERRMKSDPKGPQRIIYRFNKDENTIMIGLHDQLYDLSTSISSGTFRQALQDSLLRKNYQLLLAPTYNYSYLCFNMKPFASTGRSAFFNDVRTRKAFASLVPIAEIIRLIYGEQSDRVPRMSSYVSPLKPDCDTTLKPVGFDLSKAVKLLTEVGWKDADGNGVMEMTDSLGKRMEFEPELLFLNSSPDWKGIAELIAASAAKAGIRLRLSAVDPVEFTSRARQHEFDLLLGSWGGNAMPEDPSQLWSTGSWKENSSNYSGFGNDHTDRLIQALLNSRSDSERKSHSAELQHAIVEEQPYVFLYNAMRRMVIHRRWSDVMVLPDRPGYLPDQWKLRSKKQP